MKIPRIELQNQNSILKPKDSYVVVDPEGLAPIVPKEIVPRPSSGNGASQIHVIVQHGKQFGFSRAGK